ncbi:helix-turn-helix transcriptional regulator [Actinoallomurus sp. NPDC052274]|uniref:helix-turn-helix domain-containing protein n=1 Tax=Actinoallomurus sp. NPDC052274 TaxID=3155420 RepID=UPI003443656A
MPFAKAPSVRLRRIGSALRKAREENGLTIETACRRYGRSKSWLSTLENGLHSIDPQELADLLDFYGVPAGPLRESLLHLANHDRGKQWVRAYEGRISAAALDLASLEGDSERICNFEPNVIPGLLQSEAYAHALMRAGLRSPTRNNTELVRFRMQRQRVLGKSDPPSLEVVIGEAALRQQVGGSLTMGGQLQRLIEVSSTGLTGLRVLPFSANTHLGIAGPFHILSLRSPGRLTVTVVEDFTQSTFVEDETTVAAYKRIFTYFQGAALDEASSLQLLKEIASET